MQKFTIGGIQQMGVGVPNFAESWNWYIEHFGMDVRIFDEKAVAELMLPHTDGKPRERHAALAVNMGGGGGFEIWQHPGKEPTMSLFDVQLGDLGIYVTKLKCRSIEKAYKYQQKVKTEILSSITTMPNGTKHFFVRDLNKNIFEFVEEPSCFNKTRRVPSGGVFGAIIGVQNMEESLVVYRDILGYDKIGYDITQTFDDFADLPGGKKQFRRILLQHTEARRGPFSPLLGSSQIELVQVIDRVPQKIYDGRIWGDPGFIHICYDVQGMNEIRQLCASKGFPFTVDSSSSFDMGDAAGHFCYIQAPEGTLIEFTEAHRVPIMKKIGWFIDLKKRNPNKPLPRFLLKAMSINRIKRV